MDTEKPTVQIEFPTDADTGVSTNIDGLLKLKFLDNSLGYSGTMSASERIVENTGTVTITGVAHASHSSETFTAINLLVTDFTWQYTAHQHLMATVKSGKISALSDSIVYTVTVPAGFAQACHCYD